MLRAVAAGRATGKGHVWWHAGVMAERRVQAEVKAQLVLACWGWRSGVLRAWRKGSVRWRASVVQGLALLGEGTVGGGAIAPTS